MDNTIKNIGEQLIHHAKETAEFSAQRGFLDEFFPYVFVASRRMSLRAISRWLVEAYDIRVTPNALSIAMREADHYWRAIMDRVAPAVRMLSDASDFRVDDILSNRDVFDRLCGTPVEILAIEFNEDVRNDDKAFNALCDDIKFALVTVDEAWYRIPAEARTQCWRVFRDYFPVESRNHAVRLPEPDVVSVSDTGAGLVSSSEGLKKPKERKTKSAKPKRSRK